MRLQTAPAKINLALHVIGQRDDGYHLLDSLVVFANTIAACDSLYVSNAPVDGFDINGDGASDLAPDANNLVLQARDIVRASAHAQNIPTPPVHISLEKRLPIAAGIGGGSADAAATIKLLHAHWKVPYDAMFVSPAVLSSKLGADVPMCLLGAPLRASGIGESIQRLENIPSLHLVLVNCGESVSTPSVFEKLSDKNNPPMYDLPESNFVAWLKDRTRNDLLEPALNVCKPIQQSLAELTSNGAQFAQMSGSGATCFGIFSSAREAAAAADNIRAAKPNWWVVATKSGASQDKHRAEV